MFDSELPVLRTVHACQQLGMCLRCCCLTSIYIYALLFDCAEGSAQSTDTLAVLTLLHERFGVQERLALIAFGAFLMIHTVCSVC